MINDYINYPEKYVFQFEIKEKNNRTRKIITYNKSKTRGLFLREEHQKDIDDFRRNFWDRNSNSFAYHKHVNCVDAITSHLKSTFFIKLDIHHFFESITYDNFLSIYGNRFNNRWKQILKSFFYKDNLSIGFVSSPLISDYYMSLFDNAVSDYLVNNPSLHYSRYSDDMLLSSEEDNDESLNKLFDFVVAELAKLNLEINDKKTKKVKLDYEKHNSISFLGLNISKADPMNNKVTISKRYITFLLFLIEKNNRYASKCKELCDEINSRVAYLAYSSPISFERFQKKHFFLYGKEYDFIPKKVENRTQPIQATDIENYEQYLDQFEFDIHYKMVEKDTGSVKIPDAIALKRYKVYAFGEVVHVPNVVNVIGKDAFSSSYMDEVVLPNSVKVIAEDAFKYSKLKKINIPKSLGVIGTRAFYNTTKLEHIDLPLKISKLKESTFEGSGIKEIEIPNNVKTIERKCFKDCSDLLSVTIHEGIDVIPESCFENCLSLKQVTLPEGIISIEKNAFKNCLDLEEIVLPKTLISLDATAFKACYSLKKLVIPSGTTDIINFIELKDIVKLEFEEGHPLYKVVNNSIVEGDRKLVLSLGSNIVLEGIETIGRNAFLKSNIESITIPSSVKMIETTAFKDCKFLKEVILPDSILEIANGAFSGCVSLKEIRLPKNIQTLNKKVFERCFRLEKVTLPEGLKKISDLAFYGCRNLKDLSIPESLVELGYAPFELCNSLKSLEFGPNLKKIHEFAFSSLSKSLESIKVDKGNRTYTSMDSNIIVTNKEKDLIFGCKNSIVPEGVKTIHKKAFENCNQLISLDLPKTLERIGDNAFYKCNRLKSVKASSIFELGKRVFYGCSDLEEFALPESLTKIGDECFAECRSLKEAILPLSISQVGKMCFANCTSLKKIFIPTSINHFVLDWFSGCNNIEMIEVHENKYIYSSDECKCKYSSNNCNVIIANDLFGLSGGTIIFGSTKANFANLHARVDAIGKEAFRGLNIQSIVIPEGVLTIGDRAFCDCRNLETVVLPKTLAKINASAFENCTSLKSIIIPSKVEIISSYAFKNCTSLVNIDLPDSLKIIGSSTFENCSSLKEIKIQKNIKEIPFRCFACCTGLEKAILPSDVEIIDESAFRNCSSLANIDLPESITQIGGHAFESCVSLTEVKVPSKVKVLNHAFYNCKNLKEVEYPDSLEDLDITSFINTSITELFIPKSVYAIRFDNNIDINQFESIKVDKENECFTDLNSNIICEQEKDYGTNELGYALLFGCNNSKLPEGLFTIRQNAFRNCQKLVIDKWPQSLVIIQKEAFYNCYNLRNVELTHLTKISIAEKAFYNCNIEKLTINSKDCSISSDSFMRDDLTKEIRNLKIDHISSYSCGGNYCISSNLGMSNHLVFSTSEFIIPEGVDTVYESAFLGMHFGDNLVIPNGVTMPNIPENNIIKHITLDKVDRICVAKNCNAIEDIKISSSHKNYKLSSDSKALMSADGKTLLFLAKDGVIPDCVERIDADAINPTRNPNLFITRNIEKHAISNSHLSIEVDKENPYYDDDNGNNCIVKTETKTLTDTSKNTKPSDNILGIDQFAYSGRNDITNIYVGKNVKNINVNVFKGLESLKTITVSEENSYYYSNETNDKLYSKKSNILLYSLPNNKKEAIKERSWSICYKGEKSNIQQGSIWNDDLDSGDDFPF